MKLKQRLILFTLVAIIIPILGIAVFSSIQIYNSSIKSQKIYLDEIVNKIKSNIISTKDYYSRNILDLSKNDYLKEKLYLYNNYWDQIDQSTLDADIIPLKEEIEKYALSKDIDSIAIYRKSYDKYKKVVSIGLSNYIPDEIFAESLDKYYNDTFNIFSKSIYFNSYSYVSKNDKEIGIILMQRSFDKQYFMNSNIQYGIDLALLIKERFIYTSYPNIEENYNNFGKVNINKFYSYDFNGITYNLFKYDFNISDAINGIIFIGLKKNNYSNNNQSINISLVLFTILCALIPVITLYLWGSRMIKSIRELVKATNVISDGNYDYQIEITRKDELGYLSKEFNIMTQALKKNNQALERNNKDLTLLNNYIDAVFQSLLVNTLVIDRDYKIVLVNQSAGIEFKLPENITDLKLFSVPFFSLNREEILKITDNVFKENKILTIDRMKNDNNIYSVNFFPIKDNDSTVNGIIIVIINNTEHLSLENAIIKSEKYAAVGQFASGIAHEIGNPMSIILNHVQLIATGKLSKKEEKDYIARVESEIKRINSLIEKLLNFTKNELLSMEKINISELLRQLLDLFEPKFKEKKINIKFQSESESFFINGNLDSLKQVFYNIIINSIQAIHSHKGKIEINLSEENDLIEVKIKDNGIGIKKEELDKVFDPFFSSQSKKSTGLGLSLSYKLIKKHKGNITIESENKKGTIVRIHFPKINI